MLILRLLASYLTLGVDPPDPDPDPPAGGQVDPPADGDPDGDEDLNLGDDDDPDGDRDRGDGDELPDDPDALKAQVRAERAAREKAERDHREATERAAAADRARQQPPNRSQEQELFEREQARLADPACTANERWQIESNRTLRANARVAEEALRNSYEMADKAEFARICAAKPVLKRYEKRVEERLAEIRKGGGNMQRELIAKFLIGDDIMNGKVKSKSSKRAEPAAGGSTEGQQRQQTQTRVDRGAPPRQRGDVRGRAPLTDAQKRAQRLEGQQI